MPVRSRGIRGASTSASVTGRTARPRGAPPRPVAAAATVSSVSVFHSPQPGHWPIQRGESCPHWEQTWRVVGRGTP